MLTFARPLLLLLLATLATFASDVHAQFSMPGGTNDSAKRLTASIAVYEGQVVAGGEAHIGVLLDIQPTWKIQAGKGSGDEREPYVPTEVNLAAPEGWEIGDVLWPEAKTFTMGEGEFQESLAGYDGRVLIAIPLLAPQDAAPGEYELSATVRYQACDPRSCDIPTSTTVTETITLVEELDPTAAGALDEEVSGLFAKVLARNADQSPEEPESNEPTNAVTEAAVVPANPTFFGWELPRFDGPAGLLLLALFAMIGGFLLNLTPCVLPVIPIKIMTIMQHAHTPGKNLVLGLWMAVGVIAFWVAIGLPVAFVSGITDPSRIFGIWWLTLGIGALIALMGVGIMGMFTIQLPNAVYAINPKADTAWGSFFFGVMTGVLGLPCFGFVAGALLVGAATMPAANVLTIFTSLGLGMAAPYLILSAKPSLIESVPRTGPASELVKQVMGLLLLAAAAYFIGSGLIALVSEQPYMARQLHWWAVAIFAAIAGLWLIVRTFQITSRSFARACFMIVGLVMGGIAILYATDSTLKARHDWQTHQAALAAAGETNGYVHGVWNQWTPASFTAAREDGHIVVLDFTAEWCVNCKVLKASVLNRDPVASRLSAQDVVKFTVDLTSESHPGWDFMRDELGKTGIPLLAIYTPGREEPWQANAYTPQQVLDAIESASSQRMAQR